MKIDTSLNALGLYANRTSRTMEDTRESIRNNKNLKPRQRVELLSRLNTFERIAAKPLRDIPEDIVVIREMMERADFVGIEFSTWKTTKSAVMRCLRLCGVLVMSGRCKTPCSPEWRILLDTIPGMPHRTQLTRLTRYCCEHGIEPRQFDQRHADDFRVAMATQFAKAKFQKIYLACVNMWNRCVTEFPDRWPQIHIVPRWEVDTYSYPESAFHPNFRSQVERIVADAIKQPLGRMSARARIGASTADKRHYTLYRLGSIVARLRGVDPCTIERVEELVDPPETLNAALDFIARRVSELPDDELYLVKTGDMHNICWTMHTIAKYDLELSEDKLKVIENMRANVAPTPGAAESTIALFEKMRKPEVQEDFLLSPDEIIDKLLRKKKKTRADAITAQTAVVWAFQLCAPLRGANAVQLREGETLFWHGSGRNRILRIVVPGDKTKNEIALRFVLRPDIVRLYEIYKKVFFPLLGYKDQGYLCPGRENDHKRASQLSARIAKLSSQKLGIRMTAHKWRHAVGYIYLLHNPGRYEPIRRLLGHKSVKTTERYYAFMLAEDAQDEINAMFDEIRERGRERLRRNSRDRKSRHE